MESAGEGRQEAEEESVAQQPPVMEPPVPHPSVIQQTVAADTLAQMLTAVTQLIQDSRQSGGSGGMDKYLKQFQDMKPPLFKGKEGPMDAENWLLRVKKILNGMHCPEERRVALATFTLDGEAERWWRGTQQDRFEDLPNDQIQWELFEETFRDWFIPLSSRRQMQDKFIRLVQRDRSLMEYEAEFTMLSRYAPQLIPTPEEKCYRFLSGLKDAIRQPLVPLGIIDYAVLVERARMIEMDLQNSQSRYDFSKRKNTEATRQSQGPQSQGSQPRSFSGSGGLDVKRSRVENGSQNGGSNCENCGRSHRGECLKGSNICFRCYQPGHTARYCPTLGQKASEEGNADRRSRVPESTASAPAQGQQRQQIRPRVYSLTQREQEEPTLIDGGEKIV